MKMKKVIKDLGPVIYLLAMLIFLGITWKKEFFENPLWKETLMSSLILGSIITGYAGINHIKFSLSCIHQKDKIKDKIKDIEAIILLILGTIAVGLAIFYLSAGITLAVRLF